MYEIEIQDNFNDQTAFVVETNASPVQAVNGKVGNVIVEKKMLV
jgi:hypothetical protein